MIEQEDVVTVLRDIAREMPDRVNPWTTVTDEEEFPIQVCQYTSAEDPTCHCIAGEALIRLGQPCPGPGDQRSVYAVVHQEGLSFSNAATHLLERAQGEADGSDGVVVNPQPWGQAVEKVLNDLRLPYVAEGLNNG